jgi:O-antigen/teichoic acid export membrane protein
MMVLGKYFLMLFGSEFTSGEYLIWILAIGIVLRSSVGPAESLLVMAGGQNACASIYALNVLVNIMLNFSLIPLFGLAGAAIATTSALAFESLALHALAKRKLGIHVFIIPQRSTPAGNAA